MVSLVRVIEADIHPNIPSPTISFVTLPMSILDINP